MFSLHKRIRAIKLPMSRTIKKKKALTITDSNEAIIVDETSGSLSSASNSTTTSLDTLPMTTESESTQSQPLEATTSQEALQQAKANELEANISLGTQCYVLLRSLSLV
jgi:hypothetical protein